MTAQKYQLKSMQMQSWNPKHNSVQLWSALGENVHQAVLHFSLRDWLYMSMSVCTQHSFRAWALTRKGSSHSSWGHARTPWGATFSHSNALRGRGEDSGTSGKQSRPNWSLTGLTCLHLLEAWESYCRARPLPFINHREVNSPSRPDITPQLSGKVLHVLEESAQMTCAIL